jgi:hypothetical protein
MTAEGSSVAPLLQCESLELACSGGWLQRSDPSAVEENLRFGCRGQHRRH